MSDFGIIALTLAIVGQTQTAPLRQQSIVKGSPVAIVDAWVSPSSSAGGSGTGTYVQRNSDGTGVVVTAAHIFEGSRGPCVVKFNDSQKSGGRVLVKDVKADVAIILIFAPKDIEPIPLAEAYPKLREPIEIAGYPAINGRRDMRTFVAYTRKPLLATGERPDDLAGAIGSRGQVTISGDSGGPAIKNGRMVGLHWGWRGGQERSISIVPVQRIRQLARNIIAK